MVGISTIRAENLLFGPSLLSSRSYISSVVASQRISIRPEVVSHEVKSNCRERRGGNCREETDVISVKQAALCSTT